MWRNSATVYGLKLYATNTPLHIYNPLQIGNPMWIYSSQNISNSRPFPLFPGSSKFARCSIFMESIFSVSFTFDEPSCISPGNTVLLHTSILSLSPDSHLSYNSLRYSFVGYSKINHRPVYILYASFSMNNKLNIYLSEGVLSDS